MGHCILFSIFIILAIFMVMITFNFWLRLITE